MLPHTVSLIFFSLPILWLVLFSVSRVNLFRHGLKLVEQEIEDDTVMAAKCLADKEMRRIKHAMCAEHIANAARSPFWAGFKYMSDRTYLCGYVPCGELLNSAFMQLGIYAIVVMTLVYVVFNWTHALPHLVYQLFSHKSAKRADSDDFYLVEEDDFSAALPLGSARRRQHLIAYKPDPTV